ncbi:MAG: GNAT family N-acetyltransferase [Chloroflexi bacterium]|nr:GNAT family N-acetyltransferase [Chloroflexota bacterium]
MQIREFCHPRDYPAVLNLWQGIETGIKVGRSDSLEEIGKKVARDPDLFLLAEADGEIIGTIIGGYDGRRGMIYHLAVRQDFRRRGVGDALLGEIERRLQAKGCVKCYLLVFAENEKAIRFYENRGWSEMKEDKIFGKEFA